MKTHYLKIYQNFISGVESSKLLNKVFENIEVNIKIIYINGLGFKDSINNEQFVVDFEKEINSSETGISILKKDLIKFIEVYNDLIDIVIIGDIEFQNLYKYKNDNEMYKNCFLTITLFDSSYWEITCKNEAIIKLLHKEYLNSEIQ